MKFVNQRLSQDLDRGIPIKLNLGAGMRPRPGFYSVDAVEMEGIDLVADLNQDLSALPDNCVEEIISDHTLEHIVNFLPLMREIHRITRDSGRITITVPHYSNVFSFSDPTHVRFFGLYTMYYFVSTDEQPIRKLPIFYTDSRFSIDSIFINFYREGFIDRFLGKLMSIIVNRSTMTQHFYEHRLSSLYHANEITYVMRPVK